MSERFRESIIDKTRKAAMVAGAVGALAGAAPSAANAEEVKPGATHNAGQIQRDGQTASTLGPQPGVFVNGELKGPAVNSPNSNHLGVVAGQIVQGPKLPQ